MIFTIISIIIALAWAGFLFWLGQSKKKNATAWFYTVLFAPTVIGTIVGFLTDSATYQAAAQVMGPWFIVILALVGVERILWAFSLKDAAGEDRLVWFYVIFFVPLIGWLLYRATQIR